VFPTRFLFHELRGKVFFFFFTPPPTPCCPQFFSKVGFFVPFFLVFCVFVGETFGLFYPGFFCGRVTVSLFWETHFFFFPYPFLPQFFKNLHFFTFFFFFLFGVFLCTKEKYFVFFHPSFWGFTKSG